MPPYRGAASFALSRCCWATPDGMSDNSNLVKPPSCVGVVFGAEHEVYGNTNFSAMRDQTFIPEPYAYDPTRSAPGALEQTVVAFPSIDQAGR